MDIIKNLLDLNDRLYNERVTNFKNLMQIKNNLIDMLETTTDKITKNNLAKLVDYIDNIIK